MAPASHLFTLFTICETIDYDNLACHYVGMQKYGQFPYISLFLYLLAILFLFPSHCLHQSKADFHGWHLDCRPRKDWFRSMALNLDAALEQLFRGEILSEETVKEVCERLKESLIYQPNVLPIKAPVTVVGNVHGYVTVYGR